MIDLNRLIRSRVIFASLLLLPATSWGQVTFQTLLQELANRDSFATHPNGSYTQAARTSHDPRNALGQSPLQAPHGGLNVDFGNYIRSENNGNGVTEHVVLEDTSGPGVLTRWWATAISSSVANNNYRIYLDGNLIITDSMNDLLGGNNNGFGDSLNFSTPNIAGDFYAPLPYSSSIKITWDGPLTHNNQVNIAQPGATFSINNATWYCINYRRLAPGTSVTTFSNADKTTYAADLAATNAALATPAVSGNVNANHVDNGNVLSNGQSVSHTISGTGAIRRLMVNVSGANQVTALTNTFVELIFDGNRTARVPVGHFFGNGESDSTANPYNDYSDYWRRVDESTGDMTCYWVMPFQTTGRVNIVNESGQDVTVDLEIDSGTWTWDSNSMHFYSDYLIEDNIPTYNKGGNYSLTADADWRMLTVRGRGVLVGDTLSIRNTSASGGNQWWGEGDEKIYIDYINGSGDGSSATPDHVGTGTEDYYGYSFGSATLYGSPFIGQPFAEGNDGNAGVRNGQLTVNARVRGLDAVPFNSSLKFDMEIWKWLQGSLDYDAVVHWYGVPGAVSLVPAADLAEDFVAASNGQTAQQAGVVDTAGDGEWRYLSSDVANPSSGGANLQDLTWGAVGNNGNNGYGGGQDGANLVAISNQFITTDGSTNTGINGNPGYHELAIAPAGATQSYAVARWVAGASSTGLININGSIRNFINGGDSVDFAIYVNGVQEFSVSGSSATLDESYFDFDATIAEGQTVDFVLGNGSGSDLTGDESLLRAVILNAAEPLPVAGEPVLSGSTVDTITETTANASVILSNSSADVTLFWDTQDNGTGVWPNSNALGSQAIGSVSGSITGLAPDTRYFYRFFAINTTPDPDLEDWSEFGRSFGTAFAAAQQATSFTAVAVDFETVNLSWSESFNSETGFRVERSLAGANTWSVVGTAAANATSFQDTSADGSTNYDYRVSAVNESGASTPSAIAQVTTPAQPPSQLVTVADYDFEDNQAPAGATTFGDPTYTNGKLVLDGAGDYLQISPAPIGSGTSDNFVLEFIVNATSFGSFNFVGAISNASGTNTGYGILAENTQWNALVSGNGVAGSFNHGPPPTFSIALAFVRDGGDNSLYVNGTRYDNASSDGFTLTDAGVLTIGGHGFDVPNGLFVGEIDRVRVSTFAPGAFQARDLLEFDEGAIVTEQPTLDSELVTNITATSAQAQATLSGNAADVTIFWGTTDYGTNLGDWTSNGASNDLGNQSTGAVSGAITGLTQDTAYFARLYAVNTTPNPDLSDWTDVVAFSTALGTKQVSDLAAVASAGQVNLSWTDSFNTETGLRVERSTDGNNWAELVTLGANATVHPDTTVQEGVTYYYRVIGLNGAGASAVSNTAVTMATIIPSALTVVNDWPFSDNATPAGFTENGNPTYANGQLQLDGDDWLSSADPLSGATDNYVVEGILTASAFNAFDFGFARRDIGGPNGGNNGQGLLFQDFGAGVGSSHLLNSNVLLLNSGSQLATGTPTAFAIVQNGGRSQLYINKVLVADQASVPGGTPDDFAIGTHPFDGAAGAFNGSVDRVRVSTFAAGTFNASDLLGADEGGENFASWVGGQAVGSLTGLGDDLDGDGLGNALENWFGTDPTTRNAGLTQVATVGDTTSFQHPQNPNVASDLAGSYEWSPDLVNWHASGVVVGGTTVTIVTSLNTPSAGITTVSATPSGVIPDRIFLRARVTQN